MDKIYIWCDGACRGNQFKHNLGSYGAVIKYKDKIKEISDTTKDTTNNIMELTSCIKALEAIKSFSIPVVVTMDSQYVITGINQWVNGWIKNGWRTANKKKSVENKELWQKLWTLKNQFKDIIFIKCSGHADNEGNNRADELCNIAMDEAN